MIILAARSWLEMFLDCSFEVIMLMLVAVLWLLKRG
jgi:hypothetical protein